MSGMQSIRLKVEGMSCGHCEKRVTTALLRLDGVKEAKASAKDAEVSVTFDTDKSDEAKIREAIDQAGYQPV